MSKLSPLRLALLSGTVAGMAVVLTLTHPGLTTDEPLDVRPGRTYVSTLLSRGGGFFQRQTVDAVFRDNSEHPPLGRWLLGIASTLGQPFETLIFGPDPLNLYLWSGRLAPALAFAGLLALVVHASARRYGTQAGIASGFSLLVMPRVFAHAHLGALDTFIAFFWTLALLAANRALSSRRPALAMVVAGLCWGLALLTKIHAWFLIPVVGLLIVLRAGTARRAVGLLTIWAGAGLLLFFVGWPWLWYDTGARLSGYLSTGVERATIRVLYFGTVYADRDVPWHYPWFYFAVTVPIGLHLLGVVGLASSGDDLRLRPADPLPWLLLGSMALFLSLFSTRIPVYDGERLFLTIFPLWSVFIGRGFYTIWDFWAKFGWKLWALSAFLIIQGYGVTTIHPFGLSYYNALTGGLPGAEKQGLELTYWGDAVDPILLDGFVRSVPADSTAALVPTLYPGQGILTTTRAMARKGLLLSDQENTERSRWLVVSRRTAYWPEGLKSLIENGSVVHRRSRQGVWLSAVVRVAPSAPGR